MLSLKIFPALILLGLPLAVAPKLKVSPVSETRTVPPDAKDRDEMVDVGGRRLHIRCAGAGGPTVILEAGLASPSSDWDKVMPGVGEFTRVCAYDRAGIAKSDPAPKPRAARQIVEDLRALLAKTGEPGPYVLVGHSFGGLYAILYANQYPKDVAGMVLVDSSHEDQMTRFEAVMTAEQVRQSRARRAKNQEGVDTDAIRGEVRAARWRGDIPLYVLAHGNVTPDMIPPGWTPEQTAARERAWRDMQADFASRSPEGKLVVAEKSGHYIQNDQPELVIDAIRQVVALAGKKTDNIRKRR